MSEPPKDIALPFLKVEAPRQKLSPEFAYEVAGILIEWSTFEHALVRDLQSLRKFPIVKALSDKMPIGFAKIIKVWKRSIVALYPKIEFYRTLAENVYDCGLKVSEWRNQLIHGLWRPNEQNPEEFDIIVGFDMRRRFDALEGVNLDVVRAMHTDIRKLANQVWSFHLTRTLHLHYGLLTVDREPSPEHPAGPIPPKGGTP